MNINIYPSALGEFPDWNVLMGRKVTELMNSNCDKEVQTLHWDFASPVIQNDVYIVSIVNATTQKSIKVVVK